MSKLTRKNLQLFCRICLSALRPTAETTYNIHLVPNLTKLLIICTSLDIDEENNVYPKSLCQLCYDKLIDFQSFRSMAIQSAEILNDILNGSDKSENAITEKESSLDQNINENSRVNEQNKKVDDEDDDNQLLLPELAGTFCEKSIKTEPIDIEDQGLQDSMQFQRQQENIKNEIDSEYEENSTFYENNALGTSYHSTEDDYDEDEDDPDNGNTSYGHPSNYKSMMKSSTSGRRIPPKRDRTKKSLKCPRCDKQVYKQVYLDAHIRGVHEGHEKPFLCMQCNKSFTRYNQLHVHIQSNHLKNEKFVCEFEGCDAMFKMLTTLETHRKVVHPSDLAPPFSLNLQEVLELHQVQLNKEIEMDHICQQCFKKYSSKRALTEHLKRHANIKDHVCQVCGVAKVTRTELHTHMRTHEPNAEKFKCNICPQEFNHKNAIQRHVRVVHEGLRPFPCSFCPKKFGTRNSKVCHERLHTGERPYSCEICSKSFAQSEGLKSHMKNHDKSLRTHVCRFCSQRFITRKNLIDHEERHRGEKPHICEVCSRGFFKRPDMLTHRKSHTENMDRSDSSSGNTNSEPNNEGINVGDICDNGSSQSSS